MIWKISDPRTTAERIFPRPPNSEMPPTTIAATAVNSMPSPILAVLTATCIVYMTPAIAAKVPEISSVVNVRHSIGMPIRRAMSSLLPMAVSWRPNGVRQWRR